MNRLKLLKVLWYQCECDWPMECVAIFPQIWHLSGISSTTVQNNQIKFSCNHLRAINLINCRCSNQVDWLFIYSHLRFIHFNKNCQKMSNCIRLQINLFIKFSHIFHFAFNVSINSNRTEVEFYLNETFNCWIFILNWQFKSIYTSILFSSTSFPASLHICDIWLLSVKSKTKLIMHWNHNYVILS